MNKFLRLLLSLAFSVFCSTVSAGITPTENLRNAENELTATLAKLDTQLDPTQKDTLSRTKDAWLNYRKLANEFVASCNSHVDPGQLERATNGFSGNLVWLWIGHLNRMMTKTELIANAADFGAADAHLNSRYKKCRRSIYDPHVSDKLKAVEIAWIKYRDAATDFESCFYRSAALQAKTDLTWERAALLNRHNPFYEGYCVLNEPPDPSIEVLFEKFYSEKREIWKQAFDGFARMGEKALPHLVHRLELGGLSDTAAPIFSKLGPEAIPPLVELMYRHPPRTKENVSNILTLMAPAVVPEIVKALESEDPDVLYIALTTIVISNWQRTTEPMPALIKIINGPERKTHTGWDLRRWAAEAGLRIDAKNPDLAAAIIAAYRSAQGKDKDEYFREIERLGPAASEVLPEIIRESREKDPGKLLSFCRAGIVSPENMEVTSALIERLVEPRTSAWRDFRDALIKIGQPAAPALINLLKSQEEVPVQRTAATLAKMHCNPKETVPVLLRLAKSPNTMTAVSAIDSLGEYGKEAEDAIPILLPLFQEGKSGIAAASITALHAIAPDRPEVKDNYLASPFFMDPFYTEGRYYEPGPRETGVLCMMKADFNNDGLEDLAIVNDRSSLGNFGGGWSLYMKITDRKYKRITGLEASVHLVLHKKEKGVGYIEVYGHMSAGYGTLSLYKVTMDGMAELSTINVFADGTSNLVPVEKDARLPIPEGSTAESVDSTDIPKLRN